MIYYVDEKIDHEKKGKYVPVSIKLVREDKKEKKDKYLHQLYSPNDLDRRIKQGVPVYIVTFIQHTGKDEATKYFFDETDARRYISMLDRVITEKQNVRDVDLHYDSGRQNLHDLLKDIPMNTYTSFKTPKDTFSVTLARAK